jgi:hypothetical protein
VPVEGGVVSVFTVSDVVDRFELGDGVSDFDRASGAEEGEIAPRGKGINASESAGVSAPAAGLDDGEEMPPADGLDGDPDRAPSDGDEAGRPRSDKGAAPPAAGAADRVLAGRALASAEAAGEPLPAAGVAELPVAGVAEKGGAS